LLSYYQRWQHLRHLVKPGITGWWQIHHRDSEPMHLNVEKDIYYVCNQRPALDVRIVIGTLRVLVQALVSRRLVAARRESGSTLSSAELTPTVDPSHKVI
jgi:lipopolysaccharide/colanic/teichoic acid biosynthesis glycosyltransferase